MSNGPTPMAAIRLRLGSAIADAAVFDGWSAAAVAAAAAAEGVAPEIAELAFAADTHNAATMLMIDAWIDHIDAAMAAALPADLLATLPISERIRRLAAEHDAKAAKCSAGVAPQPSRPCACRTASPAFPFADLLGDPE